MGWAHQAGFAIRWAELQRGSTTHPTRPRWAQPTLRWEPEQNLALHRFNEVAEPGVANARPTAVDLGGDGGLIVERRELTFFNRHANEDRVSFLTPDLGRLL